MIRNLEEKKYKEKQIAKLENILLSLKEKLLPDREEQYKIMAQVYVNMIHEIREEIEEYTGMNILAIERKDINIHIEGPSISYGSAPISIISSYLDNFKKTLQSFYLVINKLDYKRVPKFVSSMSDLQLINYQPGSVNLALSLPQQQLSMLDGETIEKSLETYFNIIKWANNEDLKYIEDIEEDVLERLLIQTLKTLPDNKNIKRITFFGDVLKSKESVTLNYEVREKIRKSLIAANNGEEVVSVCGCVRELDLDKLTLVLRNIDNTDLEEVKCKLNNKLVDDIKMYLDSKVVVNGIKRDNVIIVKYIELVEN